MRDLCVVFNVIVSMSLSSTTVIKYFVPESNLRKNSFNEILSFRS